MDKRTDNLIEISWIIKGDMDQGIISDSLDIPSDLIKEWISDWANEFEEEYADTDWDQLFYSEEIENFTKKKVALELWNRFDTPVGDDDRIEEEWNGFSPGTNRFDIWQWFEETFDVCIGDDLMGQ